MLNISFFLGQRGGDLIRLLFSDIGLRTTVFVKPKHKKVLWFNKSIVSFLSHILTYVYNVPDVRSAMCKYLTIYVLSTLLYTHTTSSSVAN